MRDQHSEQLSSLIDGELSEDDMVEIVSAMQSKHELQHKLDRYGVIRSAMRGDQLIQSDHNLSERVRMAVQDEPTVFAPRKISWGNWRSKGIAVAASVMALAVLVAYQLPESSQPLTQPILASQSNQQGESSNQQVITPAPNASTPLVVADVPKSPSVTSADFDAYLLNHNQNASMMQMPGMLPSARLVTYGAE